MHSLISLMGDSHCQLIGPSGKLRWLLFLTSVHSSLHHPPAELQVVCELQPQHLQAKQALQRCLSLLGDPEVRVREQSGHVLGIMAALRPDFVWEGAEQPLLNDIATCWVSSSAA